MSRFFRFGFYFCAVMLVNLCVPVLSRADDPAPTLFPPTVTAFPVEVPPASAPKPAAREAQLGTDQVETAFYQALNHIYSNEFSVASDKFAALTALAGAAGFENLPSYSFVLLERVEQLLKTKEQEKALFLLRWAEDLSPRDARVAFALATFSDALGVKKALGEFWHGIRLSFSEPLFAGAIALNVCLVGLVALTLSALFVCLVQIVRNSETIFESFYALMPSKTRGIVGPALLLMVLLIPPFAGILCAVGIWSFLLSRTLKKCRYVAAASGVLILAWGLAIPVLATGGANVNGSLLRVVEALENNSLFPGSAAVLQKSLNQPGESPVIRFSHAEALALDGKVAAAETEFKQLLRNAGGDAKLETALQLNLAVLTYRQSRFAEAREMLVKLETDGKKSFELYYDLALAHLAELNTEQHRKYYDLADGLDRSRLVHLESSAKEQFVPLMLGVPRLMAFPLLFRMDRSSAELGPKIVKQQKLLASSMFVGMTPQLLVLIGIALLLSGLAGAVPERNFRSRAGTQANKNEQLVWLLLPGGSLFAGSAPGKGLLVLGIFLGWLIAAYEMPLKAFQILPGERGLTTLFFVGAAATFALGLAVSLVHERRSRNGIEE